jgi:hypothetical protein
MHGVFSSFPVWLHSLPDFVPASTFITFFKQNFRLYFVEIDSIYKLSHTGEASAGIAAHSDH